MTHRTMSERSYHRASTMSERSYHGATSPSLLFSDYSHGFGGKFGVQTDRVDKSAVGYEHKEKVEKHESQQGDKY